MPAMYRRARMHAGPSLSLIDRRARAVPVTLIELAARGCQKKKTWEVAVAVAVHRWLHSGRKKSRVWFG